MKVLLLGRRAALGLLIVAAGACNNFLDVNTNPNAPGQVGSKLILPPLTGIFSLGVIGSWPSSLGAEWTQQIAYNGPRANMKIEQYEVFPSEMDRPWGVSYDQIMNNARILSAQAAASSDYEYSGIAKVLFAWNMSIVTDMWGPAPYSQAFDPTNPHPKYDDQKDIYVGIFKTLDSAVADLSQMTPGLVPGTDDLLYGGDRVKWLKLAYTLQARLQLQLSNAQGESKMARAQAALAALQNGFTSNADDADFKYYDVANQRNPWYGTQLDTRVQMAKHYVDLLQSLNDPRLAVQAIPAPATGTYVGEPNGGPAVDIATISSIGHFYNAGNATLTWISYADAKMTEAEARLITQGAAAADAPYRDAIRAHMQKLHIADAAIQTYLAARPSLASVANPESEIITQKYIINYLNYQAYNDWRRTGYPVLTPVPGALLTAIPTRFRTPGSEVSSNFQNVQATNIDPGEAGMLVHVWWMP